MNTLEFFECVLPSRGYVCLAEFAPGKKPYHTFYENQIQAATAAVRLDGAGKTVYHACATFQSTENRKQENAAYMRSFWVDADVDPANSEKYPSQKEAVVDVGRVCRELRLPLPLIVKSGAGIHAYWILDADLEAARWKLVASRFKSALEHLGFRQDRTRTSDAASVLRPVGTTWRKREGRPVTGVTSGSPIGIGLFESRLESYADRVGTILGGHDRFSGAQGTRDLWSSIDADDLGSGREYPPSSAARIIRFCATLAHVADRRGDVEEPLWRGMLGVVKHTIEGVQQGHGWSNGYVGYNAAETEEKINGWNTGPTTCVYFRGTNGNKCTGCPQNVSSPIHLGYSQEHTIPVVPSPEGVATEEVAAVPTWWPKGYGWTGQLSYWHEAEDENDCGRWVPFCDTLWFPVQRVRGEDGVWNLRIKHRGKNNHWHEFELPCELIGSQQGLAGALAAHEVFVYGKSGVGYVKELLRQYTLSLQQRSVEQITYQKLGWADDFRGFVVGNQRITGDALTTVLAGEQVRKAGWDKDFGCAGTIEEWVRLVDVLYNRDGAEPYQFTIGCAFAAPLVEITEASNWHGIPVALTGVTGLGKTTTCKAAVSLYGQPSNFMVASGKDGATMNAMVSRVGTARNLPLIFDELTDRDSDEVSSFLYSLSAGRPKDRNRADGTIIDLGLTWNTVSFITSNKNITELLFLLDEQAVTEATQIRVFEIPLQQQDIEIWGNTNAVELIEHQLIEGNYGHAGRVWLRYIIENRGRLKDEVRKLRARYNPNSAEDTRERYYRDLIAAVMVALKHASKLKLVKFDLVNIAKWAKANTLGLRVRRHAQSLSPDEFIAHFLHSLHGRTITTKRFRDGRGNVEMPLEPVRGEPLARMALEDKVFVVLRKAVADWCQEHRLQVSTFIDELDKRGMIKHGPEGAARRERIGKGTNLPSTAAVCYELVFDSVIGSQAGSQEAVM